METDHGQTEPPPLGPPETVTDTLPVESSSTGALSVAGPEVIMQDTNSPEESSDHPPPGPSGVSLSPKTDSLAEFLSGEEKETLSMIIQMFASAKSQEVIDIFIQGASNEKSSVADIMAKIDASHASKYSRLRR